MIAHRLWSLVCRILMIGLSVRRAQASWRHSSCFSLASCQSAELIRIQFQIGLAIDAVHSVIGKIPSALVQSNC